MSRIDELRARDERQAARLGLERPDACAATAAEKDAG